MSRCLPIADRFWPKVNKLGPRQPGMRTRCHQWVGAVGSKGYGQFKLDGKQLGAHVVVWFLATGEWPTKYVLHKCDNKACVRKTHLFEGTHQDNMDDKVRKGRQAKGAQITRNMDLTSRRGERQWKHKLTYAVVQTMRELAKNEGVSGAELGRRFGVNKTTACRAIRGDNWRYPPP